jgi:hydrophobe/amphiphile efflux-1 (HAE1) family protein
MCAQLLQPHDTTQRDRWWDAPIHKFFAWFNWGFNELGEGVSWLASRTVRRSVLMAAIYLVVIGFGLNAFRQTPVGFIPQVDGGYIIIVVQLPPGASLSRTDAVQQRAVDLALAVPGIAHGVNVVGFSGATFTNSPNAGAIFVTLKPFEERARDPRQSAPAIQAALNRQLSQIQEGFLIAVLPPPVRGISNSGGFRMIIEDRAGRGSAALRTVATDFMARAQQTPGLAQVFTLFETSTPQVYLDIDRTKAQLLGVNVQDVFNALQVFIGSAYVNDFNLFGRTFRVTAQARDQDRRDVSDVLKIRVRNANGDTVPLGSFTTVHDISGPFRVPHYNLYPAAEMDGAPAPGYSQGQGIDAMDGLAAEMLPDGFATEWTSLAFQQIRAGNTAMFAFVLAVVFVFLVLAAQYESLTLPLAVILIVPMCLVAAIAGVIMRGMDNNILTQVGFVVLIGLAAKNAILIVEFARQLEDQGRDRWNAAVEATRLRLRPILMTSFAFILGVTPLVWAVGAGAELRQALGTAVFFGMIGVTAFGLIFTPVFYVIARWVASLGSRRGKRGQEAEQPAE